MAAVVGMAVLAAGTEEAVIRAALVGMALVLLGTTLAVAGTAAVVTGTVGVVAGIMVATVVVGELAPRLVSVLALDYSGALSRRHPIMAAMTTATITPRMPVHPHLRFGIGAMLIRAITPRYQNARFRGDRLFSSSRSRLLPASCTGELLSRSTCRSLRESSVTPHITRLE